MNVKLVLEYEGTRYHGWQAQAGAPTVEAALREAIHDLTGESPVLTAAGRTDAGVHALGQVAHFKTHSELTAAEFQRAFNALLPPGIRVIAAEEVGPAFHARWQALAKTYHYRIFRGPVVPPFDWRYVLHYPYPLDEAAMCSAARLLEGEHDFTSFAASSGSEDDDRERTALRVVYRSELVRDDSRDALTYVVRGRSFLRYMVRKMVGTLLDVGRGKLAPDDILRLFELRDRSRSGPTVPPQGLCMVSVEYPDPTASLAPGPEGANTL